MTSVASSMRSIFEDAQHPMQARATLVSRLQKIKDDARDDKEFFKLFVKFLKHSMVVLAKEPKVERTIDFVVLFATAEDKYQIMKHKQGGNVSDEEDEKFINPFLENLLKFLLGYHDSKLKAVRYRTCQIITKLFIALADDVSIDEDLAEKIYDCLVIRLRDKIASIRAQAVLATWRLQDIENEDCLVINKFLDLMEKDNNADVRRAVLCNIALTPKTLEPVLCRTRDVNENVRKAAYGMLAEKVKIRSLTIAQRLRLLECGLNDKSKAVKEECVGKLIKAWLVDCDNKVDTLLERLHAESAPETVAQALKAWFEGLSEEQLKKHIEALRSFPQEQSNSNAVKISYDSLQPEIAMYWKLLVQHIKSLKDRGDELMDEVLPLASEFCDYIQEYAEKHTNMLKKNKNQNSTQQSNAESLLEAEFESEFIMQQLLELCDCFDHSDEIGRIRMQTLIQKLFIFEKIPISLVESLVERFAETETNEVTFVQWLVEIISELRKPMIPENAPRDSEEMRKREIEHAKLRVNLNELREALDESIKSEDFAKAAEIKQKIAETQERVQDITTLDQTVNQTICAENNDPEVLLKCLYIASKMLQRIHKIGLTPTIKALAETLIMPSVQNHDALIRNLAVKCLGLISLLCKEFASEHFLLFLKVLEVDQQMVQITATQIIFDLIQLYGFDAFKDCQRNTVAESVHGEELLEERGLNDNNESEDMFTEEDNNCTDGGVNSNGSNFILNTLVDLLNGESPEIRLVVAEGICKLLISGRVKSSNLFIRLVLLWYDPKIENDIKLKHCLGVFLPIFAFDSSVNQELIGDSFLPILKAFHDEPAESSFSSIDISNVIELLVQLTNTNNLQKHGRKTDNQGMMNDVIQHNVHDTLAIRIANEILSETCCCDVKLLCRALTLLEISPANQTVIKELNSLSQSVLQEVQGKAEKKMILKFQHGLRIIDTSEDSEAPSDTVAPADNEAVTDEYENE